MPTYEYKCQKCGKKFERIERVSEHDASHMRCPKCKSTQVAQVYGTFFAKTSRKS
ncbi:MAG: zinc ribbon domain-containing protein [Gammaproteobacteria bacterium]|nr:zinc ribbon domain-containing protein [Gammaproteobacteria bacterium]